MYLKNAHMQNQFDYASLESKLIRGPYKSGECTISLNLYSNKVSAPKRTFKTNITLFKQVLSDFGTDEEIEALNERAVGWKPFGPFDLFSDATQGHLYRVTVAAFRQDGDTEVETATDDLVFSDGCTKYFLRVFKWLWFMILVVILGFTCRQYNMLQQL